MKAKAEQDEFRIFKAQLDSRMGRQQRVNRKQLRKRSDDQDPDKYNQIVVADDQEMNNEYQSAYRGRVQNRRTEEEPQPMYMMSLFRPESEVSMYVAYDRRVDSLQHQLALPQLCLTTRQPLLSERGSKEVFGMLDSLSLAIDQSRNTPLATQLLLKRAIAYATIQNYQAAIEDLTICLLIDSTSVVSLWLRSACQDRVNEFQASEGVDIRMKTANVLVDLEHAVRMAPDNAYLVYNRGNIFLQRKDYREAEADYTRAIAIDGRLAEAYFNRGLCRLRLQNVADAIADFSKAGELGLYTAYSLMKQYSK